MKIYTVYKNEMHEVDVQKETEQYYYIDKVDCFSFAARIKKDQACLSKGEAALENHHKMLERFGYYNEKKREAKHKLEKAKKLVEKYN